ncbi:hypothetical protein BG003_004224 [Podila horticola]|nr:hypothetical protein BG003_004224 [Podila horticola]
MSNIYLLEPHTSGKVILHTSDGDIAIELWPKEAPKACRNFIQLCMEGYYTNTIFHRIVAGFIIQGGDPEGTGEGGESAFEDGKPFADEFHSRLRFVRRGLVAMANSGEPNDNKSQFFITLDATPELQNKHTIFGKIGGDTIFNVLKIGSLEVDANERPLYPPTVTGCTIVVNPFDDIVPRISRQEREAARLRELEAQKKPEKQKKQKKNVALLSFADDAPDEDGENGEAPQKKKMMSSHDLLDEDPTLSKDVDTSLLVDLESKPSKSSKSKKSRDESKEEPRKESRRDEDEVESFNDFDQRMRDQVRSKRDALQKKSKTSHESGSSSSAPPQATSNHDTSSSSSSALPSQPLTAREKTQQEIQKLENDIRKMHNRNSDDDESSKKHKPEKISYLQQEREQYKTRKELSGDLARNKRSKAQANADKEREMLEKLSAFERKVSVMAREPEPNPAPKKNDAPPCKIHGVPSCESCQDTVTPKSKSKRKQSGSDGEEENEREPGEEGEGEDSDDNDIGWMQHKLVFEKDLKGKEVSLSAKRDDVNDYIVIDPLNKANATSKAIAMEKQRNQEKRRKQSHYADKDSRGGRDAGRDDRDKRNRDSRDDRRPYDRPSSSSSSSRRDDRDRSDRHSDSRGSSRRDDHKDDYRREPGRANRDRW